MPTPSPTLAVIVGSTRPGRSALPVARWFAEQARAHSPFDVDVVDLAEVALPMLDEPHHPRLRQYVHEHTRAWSRRVDRADAVVIVTPEYNHGYPAVLKNALDYLHGEWADKPVGFVSYGGVSGGTRAVQQLKQVVAGLRMTPVVEAVAVPFAGRHLRADEFRPEQPVEQSARAVLQELARLERALSPLRDQAADAA